MRPIPWSYYDLNQQLGASYPNSPAPECTADLGWYQHGAAGWVPTLNQQPLDVAPATPAPQLPNALGPLPFAGWGPNGGQF